MGATGVNLSLDQRWSVISWLLAQQDPESRNGVKHGAVKAAASHFSILTATVSSVWSTWRKKQAANSGFPDTSNDKAGNVGRKRKWTPALLNERLAAIPLSRGEGS